MPTNTPTRYKGNKQSLPRKMCVGCGREMTWRKRWARSWEEVKFCSDACRQRGPGQQVPAQPPAGRCG